MTHLMSERIIAGAADSIVAVNILSMFKRIDLATVTGKKQYKVGEL